MGIYKYILYENLDNSEQKVNQIETKMDDMYNSVGDALFIIENNKIKRIN